MSDQIERRVAEFTLERRADGDEQPVIRGHAAVFETPTRIMDFDEQIARGAFTRALKEKQDVRALFNHDPNHVLGRTPKTLRMDEDKVGLAVEIDPPSTAAGLLESMARGDVNQMSFGFVVKDEEWRKGEDGEVDLRTIKDVDLFDVSVVTFPAYPETDAAVRSHEQFRAEVEMAEESERNAAPEPEKPPADIPARIALEKMKLDARLRD